MMKRPSFDASSGTGAVVAGFAGSEGAVSMPGSNPRSRSADQRSGDELLREFSGTLGRSRSPGGSSPGYRFDRTQLYEDRLSGAETGAASTCPRSGFRFPLVQRQEMTRLG